MRKRQTILLAFVLLAVIAAYANSFQNSFHFDDFHTIVDNPAIRTLHNAPRFFTDATTFSVLPPNRTYRPFVSLSLAIDYALGHGYQPFWFHLSTLLVFLLQLATMFWLYRNVLRKASETRTISANIDLAALAAVAWYGLHPAMAETVNYIIQRGDIYSTLGVVASLALFATKPRLRRTGLYLFPFLFGILSKPPAIVLPALLFAYVAYFEAPPQRRWRQAAIASLPSIATGIAAMALQSAMTPKTYAPSIISTSDYVITQPFVLLRYFASFFLPLHLNVDTDLEAFHSLTPQVLYGFLFLAALTITISLTARRKTLRPISFGLLWFLISSIPTSIYRLSEVENDHRMYMPFVGLALAITWTLWLLIQRTATTHPKLPIRKAAAATAVILLAAYAFGVHQRNRIWRTDESLWLDDIQKSPHNGRGLMNYGLTQMSKGNFPEALNNFTRALAFTPNYPSLEINLGVVNSIMAQAGDPARTAEAERHFQRAIALSPASDEPYTYYGRWLTDQGRETEAIAQLQQAVALNPQRLYPRELLVTAYTRHGDIEAARSTALQGLRIAPEDIAFQQALVSLSTQNVAYWINLSLAQYQRRQYPQSIASAQHALQLNPQSPEAYNNIGAAYGAMQNWDAAIAAAQKAIALKPDFQLAKNNLAWSLSQKSLAQNKLQTK